MRFAIIGNAASTLTNFRSPLIREIAGRGHSVFALAPNYDAASRAAIRSLGADPIDFPLTPTGLNPFKDIRDGRSLKYILAGLNLDGVLCFGIKPSIYGTLAAARVRIPSRYVLITGLGYAFTDGGQQSLKRRVVRSVARLLYKFAMHHADTVFMQNPDDAAEFVRMGIAGENKIIVVNGTGVELEKWRPAPPVIHPVSFLLVARMLRDKGVLEFVGAAREIKSRHPGSRFVMIGSLDANPEAIRREQLVEWVEQGIVEWPGHADTESWLAEASVFVLPSYREGVPRSTQEALAMGRPVITTDAPGCRETVVDRYIGYLVPPRDPGALAAAMQRFIDHPELIGSMGAKSRGIAVAKFDVRRINETMIKAMGL